MNSSTASPHCWTPAPSTTPRSRRSSRSPPWPRSSSRPSTTGSSAVRAIRRPARSCWVSTVSRSVPSSRCTIWPPGPGTIPSSPRPCSTGPPQRCWTRQPGETTRTGPSGGADSMIISSGSGMRSTTSTSPTPCRPMRRRRCWTRFGITCAARAPTPPIGGGAQRSGGRRPRPRSRRGWIRSAARASSACSVAPRWWLRRARTRWPTLAWPGHNCGGCCWNWAAGWWAAERSAGPRTSSGCIAPRSPIRFPDSSTRSNSARRSGADSGEPRRRSCCPRVVRWSSRCGGGCRPPPKIRSAT